MNTLKKLTALLLTFILATASVPAIFAGEIDCDGSLYQYTEEYLQYPDYKAVFEKLEKYAKKGDSEKLNKIYTEEFIPLENKYMLLDVYTSIYAGDSEFVLAVCEFDPATKTVIKVLNDASALAIPHTIDGITVEHIAEGAVSDKPMLYILGIPPTVDVIDKVIVKNCPALEDIFTFYTAFKAMFFENCPSYEGVNISLPHDSTIPHVIDTRPNHFTTMEINLGMSFAVNSGILKGDKKNGYNWYETLTRTEAAIMILRLMGLEKEVASYNNLPCSFTDVPDWAKGYINLAVEKGIVKGRSDSFFGSSDPCSAKDFLTMLFRLTDLTEGKDFSWSTIIDNYSLKLHELAEKEENWDSHSFNSTTFFNPGLEYADFADSFSTYYYQGGKFSRRIACEALYYMLHIIAGKGEKSFGDILAESYNMDDFLLYNHYVRRSDVKPGKKSDLPCDLLYSYGDTDKCIAYLRSTSNPINKEEIDPAISDMAKSITDGIKGDYEKAKAISKWVAEHIFYDLDLFNEKAPGYRDAKNVFLHRRTVCEGYANLTCEMLNSVGIECYTMSSTDHAWNVAVIDNEIILIDNTWNSPLIYSEGVYKSQIGNYSGNIMEPGIKWLETEFDGDPEEFYQSPSHRPQRAIISAITYDPEDEFKYIEEKRRTEQMLESGYQSDDHTIYIGPSEDNTPSENTTKIPTITIKVK